jgi:hypothetical protein
MITCSNCSHKEMVGAVFCSECGTQLVFARSTPTSLFEGEIGMDPPTLRVKSESHQAADKARQRLSDDARSGIYLKLMDNDELLDISGRKEITIGRASKGQAIIPDIDLSLFNAFESGVSRVHVLISAQENEVQVSDLGSANGTRVNGQRIPPNDPYPVHHGDILSLGKFKIQILFTTTGNGD